ncbi:hypothetical protein [Vibrio superstes]|uniref:Nuclear transport factor 2 family protein n=1 Tax=Vibrio superstes NBRC 103154 TaxID=1219062 RepID=A0A511QWF7_9VIBR|nr:hypothetical protein [Vibrio superstes]GEM81317.1 hypothetical protein VSU01S_35620 [Vibrio superstes NBRC 103154]
MKTQMKKIEIPIWLPKLFQAIDSLDFSENSGFEILRDDIVMQFGQEMIVGIETAKAYFKKIDEPYITEHFIHDVYQVGSAIIMHGGAQITEKQNLDNVIVVDTLLNILWLDENNRVERYVVDYPPELEQHKPQD